MWKTLVFLKAMDGRQGLERPISPMWCAAPCPDGILVRLFALFTFPDIVLAMAVIEQCYNIRAGRLGQKHRMKVFLKSERLTEGNAIGENFS